MPEITVSLPAAIAFLALFLTIGAVLVYFALRATAQKKPEIIIPISPTVTMTVTPTPTTTGTPLPPTATPTPLPTATPVTYIVQPGDNCLSIALFFKVTVQSIVTLNNLPASCNNLYPGQPLLIPQPTATPLPPPSATPNPATQTAEACERVSYTVKEGDTLSRIAVTYNVPMEAIREWNGLPGDVVYSGTTIEIPLCERPATPGPTPTATPPPPYAAPSLLLPADGAAFSLADDSITLQWASVGTLRENERYMVTVEDVTEGKGRKLVDYVTDTKFIVPSSFRLNDTVPHVYRWWVLPVRQIGTDDNGKPIYEAGGPASASRVFVWVSAAPAKTAAP